VTAEDIAAISQRHDFVSVGTRGNEREPAATVTGDPTPRERAGARGHRDGGSDAAGSRSATRELECAWPCRQPRVKAAVITPSPMQTRFLLPAGLVPRTEHPGPQPGAALHNIIRCPAGRIAPTNARAPLRSRSGTRALACQCARGFVQSR
jgi:hypothetical protein